MCNFYVLWSLLNFIVNSFFLSHCTPDYQTINLSRRRNITVLCKFLRWNFLSAVCFEALNLMRDGVGQSKNCYSEPFHVLNLCTISAYVPVNSSSNPTPYLLPGISRAFAHERFELTNQKHFNHSRERSHISLIWRRTTYSPSSKFDF